MSVPTGEISAARTVAVVRRWLLTLLVLGLAGTLVELLLMAHYEDATQWLPLAVMASALALVGQQAVRPGLAAARALRLAMAAVVVTGLLGVMLHYRGTREFQIEVDPSLAGARLFWKVVRAKAPPALAPGAMVGLGLLGLAYTRCAAPVVTGARRT